jgi:hypothetical protein
VVWAAKGQPLLRYRLACNPATGTLPDLSGACADIARLGPSVFEATPPDVLCTQVYGGPQIARVDGIVDGLPIDATFSRKNACEIRRWDRLRKVIPLPSGRDA